MSQTGFNPSNLQKLRNSLQPTLPNLLKNNKLRYEQIPIDCLKEIKDLFPTLTKDALNAIRLLPDNTNQNQQQRSPLRMGVVLSGGQAAGGHNVIAGIFDFIKNYHQDSELYGFLDGPHGIFTGNYMLITDDYMNQYRNMGGFDMIGSGRHKIETQEQFQQSLDNCSKLNLDGLAVIGGDDSNTNAALLAEYFLTNNIKTKVVGVPKTIDGDLQNEFIEMSFGFDTACRTYAEQIGNICVDCVSSKKYYHFIRLMGRSASHITLECALMIAPTVAIIGEEVQQKNIKLQDQVNQLCEIIIKRAQNGKNYGVMLIPEGLIEFFPDINVLISELNDLEGVPDQELLEKLTPSSKEVFQFLPQSIKEQLTLDRDPHGNVQVAKIDTEKLLVLLLSDMLDKKAKSGDYTGKFKPQTHYFGYEGRCALPSNFDSNYCYGLGQVAGSLISMNFTGYMSTLRNLKEHPSNWAPYGVPLVSMMRVEYRKGKNKPVIEKCLVSLDSPIFQSYAQNRDHWAINDCFRSPGPIQFYGETCDIPCFYIQKNDPSYFKFEDDDKQASQFNNRKPNCLSALEKLRNQDGSQLLPTIFENGQYKGIRKEKVDVDSQSLRAVLEHQIPNYYNNQNNHYYVEFVPQDLLNPQQLKKNLNIGIVFNGRQAPGGNNVVDGLLRFCSQTNSQLVGFIGGTLGLLQQKYIKVTQQNFQLFKNMGGYDFLGRSQDQMRTKDQLHSALECCKNLKLDGLVMIGSCHTMNDALIVQEFFLENQLNTCVVGVPATIDGDINHPVLEATIGFDSASKMYSQLIGNNMTDAASAKKYWYFMRLMGRSPSHLVLECALQTHPNIVIISEEISEQGLNLQDIVNKIANIICQRAQQKKNFGTVLIPEGLLSHVHQVQQVINEINKLFQNMTEKEQIELGKSLLNDEDQINKLLTPWSAALFQYLPDFTRQQLLLEREVNGTIQLSQIETEKLLAHLVGLELAQRKKNNKYSGSFSSVCHYFGYQGRCAIPSKFDCQLGSTYGYTAGALIQQEAYGFCVSARGVNTDCSQWTAAGIPIMSFLSEKNGNFVVSTSEVNLNGKVYKRFQELQGEWAKNEHYTNPGPCQYAIQDELNISTQINQHGYLSHMNQINDLTQKVRNLCHFGVSEDVLKIAVENLECLYKTLSIVKNNKRD